MIRKLLIASAIASIFFFASCANRKVTRIDPNQQTDISGRWNDTDSKLVANEMITDVLTRPWRSEFEQKYSKKPTVIVGSVKNKSSEQDRKSVV